MPTGRKPAKIKPMKWMLLFLVSAEWNQAGVDDMEIIYRPGMEAFAQMVKAQAPGAKKLIEQNLAATFRQPIRVIITESGLDFHGLQAGVPEWATATALPEQNTIYLQPLKDTSPENLAVTFRHELAHLLLFQRLHGHQPPRWFDEGMAVLSSGEFEYQRFIALAQIALSGRYIPFEELDERFPSDAEQARTAYLQSESLVSFLMAELGRQNFSRLLDRAASGEDFYLALGESSGMSFRALQDKWAGQIRRRYGIIAVAGGSTTLWFLITLLFLSAYIVKRRKSSQKQQMLEPGYIYPPESGIDDVQAAGEEEEDDIEWH